jgi:agmatinase
MRDLGFRSEMLRPSPHPFLSSRPGVPSFGSSAIFGVPYDRTSSWRRGSALAPSRIRAVSSSIESYSPDLDRDLSELDLVDMGDLNVSDLEPDEMVRMVEGVAKEIFMAGAFPIAIGGEHTITLGLLKAAKLFHPDLMVLHMDAHADMRDQYEGSVLNHATVIRRALEELGDRKTIHIGIRSGTREEFELFREKRIPIFRSPDPERILPLLGNAPIYITLDIDVLDPSEAPGTGNPEPGGIRFPELIAFLYRISGMKIIGADVVEVSPPYDAGDITSICAAKILREILLIVRDL